MTTNNITSTNNNGSTDMFEMMDKAYKFAEIIAKSDIIPDHYKGKPSNVFIAVQTAYRMGLDPMLVMQNTYIVSGKLGMNTTFAISLANNSGLFESGIRYREHGEGADMAVTAYTNLKKTGEEIAYTFSMKMAQAEGYTRNSKYRTMPGLMLRYRAATLLIRTHAPEVMNGMHMVEELEDVTSEKEVGSKTDSLTDKLQSALSKYTESANDKAPEKDQTLDSNDEGSDSNDKQNEIEHKQTDEARLGVLTGLVMKHNVDKEVVEKWCKHASVNSIEDLSIDQVNKCINYVEEKYGK
jgi:hypothetical protein